LESDFVTPLKNSKKMKSLKTILFACFAIILAMAFCRCNNAGGNSNDFGTAQGPTAVIQVYHSTGYLYSIHHSNYYYWASDSAFTTPASVTDLMWHSSLTEPNHRGATQLPNDTIAVSSLVNAPNLQMQLNN
jgi:hypothetical protein